MRMGVATFGAAFGIGLVPTGLTTAPPRAALHAQGDGAVSVAVVQGGRMTYEGGSASNRIERLEIRGEVSFIERAEDARVRTRPGCEKESVDRGMLVTCRDVPTVRLLLGTGNDRMANGYVSARKSCRRVPARGGRVVVRGDGGLDVLLGTSTDHGDKLSGGRGADVIRGCGGDDALAGGNGRDQLEGMAGDDRLAGGRGVDGLVGCSADPDSNDIGGDFHGNDVLRGGESGDFIYDCSGSDRLLGGAGDDSLDSIYANDRDNPDRLACGDGRDFYAASARDRSTDCEQAYGGFVP